MPYLSPTALRTSLTAFALALLALPGCQEEAAPRKVAPPAPQRVASAPPAPVAKQQPPTARPVAAPAARKPPARPAAVAAKPRPPSPRPKARSNAVKWDAPIAWKSLDVAKADAKKSGKPILMMVFADW